jgi:hypothetical protein
MTAIAEKSSLPHAERSLQQFPMTEKSEPARLKVSFSLDSVSAPVMKTFLVNHGQEGMLETLLRRAFAIPANLGVSLVLDGDLIFFPIHLIDLNEARRAKTIELQTFSAQSSSVEAHAHQPLSVPMPQFIPQVEFMDSFSPYPAQTMQPPSQNSAIIPKSTEPVINTSSETTIGAQTRATVKSAKPPVTSSRKTTKKTAVAAAPTISNTNSHVISADQDPDSDPDTGRADRRKNNRGLDHRRSYLKEEKILVMWLKDCGKSADEIAQFTQVSKSNVEKWCSDKTREKILAKIRSTGSGSGDVLGSTLDAAGLHFLQSNRVAMQSSLLFLLDRLKTLASESSMVIDEDMLFAAADLSRTKQVDFVNPNPNPTSVASKRTLSGEGMDESVSKRMRLSAHPLGLQSHQQIPGHLTVLPAPRQNMPWRSNPPPNFSVIRRGFVPPNMLPDAQLRKKQLAQELMAQMEDSDDEDDAEEEDNAHLMLAAMLRNRRASLGLSTGQTNNQMQASVGTDAVTMGASEQKRVRSSLDLLSDLTAAESAGCSHTLTNAAPVTQSILANIAAKIPTNFPQYEDVRMEYTDQFACAIPSFPWSSSAAAPTGADSNGSYADNKIKDAGRSAAIATATEVSTSGSVQALRSILPNTNYLLLARPQLQSSEEDRAVLSMLGE